MNFIFSINTVIWYGKIYFLSHFLFKRRNEVQEVGSSVGNAFASESDSVASNDIVLNQVRPLLIRLRFRNKEIQPRIEIEPL